VMPAGKNRKALSGKEFTQYRAGYWLRIKAERRAHNIVM
jgi:hypothetical protein